MKKWIVSLMLFAAMPLYAGTISDVSMSAKTADVSITEAEREGLQIDDTIYLTGRNNVYSVKGTIQAISKTMVQVKVDFGIDSLQVNDFVRVEKKDERTAQQPQAMEKPKSPPGEKSSMMSVGLLYWLGGSVNISSGAYSVDVDKEAGIVFRFSYDNISPDGNTFGFFLQYAPSVSLSETSGSGTMMEYGLALKTVLNPGEETLIKPGILLGHRTYSGDLPGGNIEAFGVNASVQIIPTTSDNGIFYDVGFMSQPTGGNDAADVTFGPIFYLGAGMAL